MEENEKSPLETIPPVLTEAEPKTGSPLRTFLGVLAGLILVLLLIVVLAFTFLSRQFDKAVQPIQEVNDRLSTQVSQFLHPTPTILPDPVSIVREVQSLARLETIQYSVEKVITAELNQGAFGSLFGDRLLFVAHGYVIAGVDLSKMTEDDLRVVGETLRVKLPEAEVFVATLDNDKSYVYDRDTGLLRRADTQLESAARRAAEAEILRTATEDGILTQAQSNVETYLLSLLNSLGFSRVVFE
jgi:hypothetical protein